MHVRIGKVVTGPAACKANARATNAGARSAFSVQVESSCMPSRDLSRRTRSNARHADPPRLTEDVPVEETAEVIRKFFYAFNCRDIHSMAEAVADDCEHCNLAYPSPFRGKRSVVQFYQDFMNVVPPDSRFEIEDTTGGGSSRKIGVIWHLQIHGTVVPNSTGVSFFRLNESSRISYVRESPEHFAKIAAIAMPTLSVLPPLVSLAQPLLRRPGHSPAAPPLYSSQSSSGHNPSYSTSEIPLSHYSASLHEWPPAVFPDPISLASQACTAAAQHLESLAHSALPRQHTPHTPLPPSTPPTHPARLPSVRSLPLTDSQQVPVTEARLCADEQQATPNRRSIVASLVTPVVTPAGMDVHMRQLHQDPPSPDSPTPSPAPAAPVSYNVTVPASTQSEPSVELSEANDARAFEAMSGVWQKDRMRSDRDGYGRALDLMGVGGLQKATALGIEGMEVNAVAAAGSFEVFYLTPVSFFKVKEGFSLAGETEHGRRDLRRGKQMGRARQEGNRVIVDVAWGEPYGGTAHEEYWLDQGGRLSVQSTVTVGGKSATTVQVYWRQEGGAVDSRYYAPQQSVPFGVDPNRMSESMLGRLLK